MYTLMRVFIKTPREITFDLWDYKNNTGYEITIVTDKIVMKHDFAMHFIGITRTITFWDELITKIKAAQQLSYASF